jgi:hypothetical protein
LPSGLKASAVTLPLCPASVNRRCPLAMSQIVIVASGLAVANNAPPGAKAAISIAWAEPLPSALEIVASGVPQPASPIQTTITMRRARRSKRVRWRIGISPDCDRTPRFAEVARAMVRKGRCSAPTILQ